jgi:hypothetical protein
MLSERSVSTYQNIVDSNFRSKFPQWDSMSSWDPIKMVAEAMTLSLVAIERHHERLVSTFIDALPSLVGFEPQSALLPVGLIEISFNERAAPEAMLKRGSLLRFTNEQTNLFASLKSDIRITEKICRVEVELFEKRTDWNLGTLKGEPWEIVYLPKEIALVPEECC